VLLHLGRDGLGVLLHVFGTVRGMDEEQRGIRFLPLACIRCDAPGETRFWWTMVLHALADGGDLLPDPGWREGTGCRWLRWDDAALSSGVPNPKLYLGLPGLPCFVQILIFRYKWEKAVGGSGYNGLVHFLEIHAVCRTRSLCFVLSGKRAESGGCTCFQRAGESWPWWG